MLSDWQVWLKVVNMKDENPFSIPNRIDWLEGKVKEMADLENRIDAIEERLGGLKVINGKCPK